MIDGVILDALVDFLVIVVITFITINRRLQIRNSVLEKERTDDASARVPHSVASLRHWVAEKPLRNRFRCQKWCEFHSFFHLMWIYIKCLSIFAPWFWNSSQGMQLCVSGSLFLSKSSRGGCFTMQTAEKENSTEMAATTCEAQSIVKKRQLKQNWFQIIKRGLKCKWQFITSTWGDFFSNLFSSSLLLNRSTVSVSAYRAPQRLYCMQNPDVSRCAISSIDKSYHNVSTMMRDRFSWCDGDGMGSILWPRRLGPPPKWWVYYGRR